jgi:formylglycine-generating enzyme
MMRYPKDPNARLEFPSGRPRLMFDPVAYGVRCAVNLDHPVAKQN